MPDRPEKKTPVTGVIAHSDPHNINARILNQVSELLTQLETGDHVTMKERYMALAAIARIQYIFMNLRKEHKGDEPDRGTTVRKYATAFKAHDNRRRKSAGGTTGPADAAGDALDDNWFEGGDDPAA